MNEEFDTKDLGKVRHILSIKVTETNDGFKLNQSAYVNELLSSMEMSSCKDLSTPLNLGEHLYKTEAGKELDHNRANIYRSSIGSLLYLATCTRPDLAFPATFLSQFNSNPSIDHWNAMKHCMRYLQHTKDVELIYKRSGRGFKFYCDADWATDVTDRKSFSGNIITLSGGAISWMSRKQKSTALSTVEAEFISLCEAVKEFLWLRNFFNEIGQSDLIEQSICVNVDNQGAMKLAENHTTSDRSKHIDLKMFFIRDQINNGTIQLKYIRSEDNLADCLTKVINGEKLKQHMMIMGIIRSRMGVSTSYENNLSNRSSTDVQNIPI